MTEFETTSLSFDETNWKASVVVTIVLVVKISFRSLPIWKLWDRRLLPEVRGAIRIVVTLTFIIQIKLDVNVLISHFNVVDALT